MIHVLDKPEISFLKKHNKNKSPPGTIPKEIRFIDKEIKYTSPNSLDQIKNINVLDGKKIKAKILPDFDELTKSTKTIIALSNYIFHLDKIFKYLPLADYILIPKKRGRKKRGIMEDPNRFLIPGSVISTRSGNEIKGVDLRKKKKDDDDSNFFKNSLSLKIVLKYNKLIDMKMYSNGKIQMTGCKDDSQCYLALKYLYYIILKTEELTGEELCKLKNDQDTRNILPYNCFSAILLDVMINRYFNLGFSIDREKLDSFMNKQEEFRSIYDGSMSTGVNIKYKNECPFNDELLVCIIPKPDKLNISKDMEEHFTSTKFDNFLLLMSEKEKMKLLNKTKHISFLCFHTGSAILSGSGPLIGTAYNIFKESILSHKREFVETLDLPIIKSAPRNSYFLIKPQYL